MIGLEFEENVYRKMYKDGKITKEELESGLKFLYMAARKNEDNNKMRRTAKDD